MGLIYRRLEAAMKIGKIRTLGAHLEHSSFQHRTFRVIVLQDDVFLQSFDGKVRASSLQLSQQHLTERNSNMRSQSPLAKCQIIRQIQ